MKRFFTILAIIALCASASAQTVKPLAYNMTNGTVMVSTNVTWSNSFKFSTNTVAAQVRTNLGLGLSALTNTNTESFLNALSAATATNWSGSVGPGAADRAQQLIGNETGNTALVYNELGGDLWQIADAVNFQSALFAATNNGPTNTTNVAGWIDVSVGSGTNVYKLPVYK